MDPLHPFGPNTAASPYPSPTLTQPVSNKPAPSPRLSQPPIKPLQQTQILAPLQPASLPSISTLPEEDEPEPEQQEPIKDQHEPEQEHEETEPDQLEPEPGQQSELLPNGVPRDLYHADGTPDYRKAWAYWIYDCTSTINNKVILKL